MSASTPTVVLDTNVVLDWFVFRDPGVEHLVQAIESGRVHWLGCAPMHAELAHVLSNGCLHRRRVSAPHVLTTSLRWQKQIDLPANLPLARLRCRDTSDQMFLDLALHGGATWLLSRDRALLCLAGKAARRGLAILTPRRWQEADRLG